MSAPFFYFFSGLVVLSALSVIFAPKPTRALLSLILTMSSLTCLYLLLGAPFVAMINLIVYAGAVLVLFLFVIMMQGVGARDLPLFSRFSKGFLFASFLLPVLFFVAFFLIAQPHLIPQESGLDGDVKAVGVLLFSRYLLPFELISVLLILAIFAAVALAKKEEV